MAERDFPLVSVVIPALNEARGITRCLRSIFHQSYNGPYEVIVVDNGSQDNTAEIARLCGAKVIQEPRKGVCFARQRGIQEAQGEIVANTDADTIVPPDWLERIVRGFQRGKDVVAVAGRVFYERPPWWVHLHVWLHVLANLLTFRLFKTELFVCGANFHFRRSAFFQVGGYNPLLAQVGGDEMDILARLKKVGRVVFDGSLRVRSDPRRFRELGLWHFLMVDILYHRIINYYAVRWFGVPLVKARLDVRGGRGRRLPRWGLAGALALLLGGAFCYEAANPRSEIYGQVYTHSSSQQREVALTFDDGPNPPYTSQILDVLQLYDVKATFFIVGKNALANPDLVRLEVAEGHEVADHSYTHHWYSAFIDVKGSDLRRGEQAIEAVTGVRPRLYRPPYGLHTPWQLWDSRREGLLPVTWSVEAGDPKQPPPEVIAQRVLARARPGSIILLHDGAEARQGVDRSSTVKALPEIITTLETRGYRFVTISELISRQGKNQGS